MNYSVIPTNTKGQMNIIKADNGMVVGSFFVQGDIVSGPTITGDTCTIVTTNGTTKTGHIYKLPSGIVLQTFSV